MRRLLFCLVVLIAPSPVLAGPMDALVRAYPDALESFDGTNLIWRDGTRMPVEDGRTDKSPSELLRSASIADQMRVAYTNTLPPEADAGRLRNAAFFNKMYGDCTKGEVARRLVRVAWLPSSGSHGVQITSVNGVDRHLAAVSRELDLLPDTFKRYLSPLGGTYICRKIADTGQTSMHGWGVAIDINVAFSDYWLWQRGAAYRNREPMEIVEIFERHGFIWGGRWAHYDTMHFEYRPELLGVDPAADP